LTGRSDCCGFVDGLETEKPRTTCCSLGCKSQVSTKPTLNDDRIQYPVPTQDAVLGWDGVSRGDAARGRLRTLLAFTRQAILGRRSAALMSARATLISAERAQQQLAASAVSASPVKINFSPRQPRPPGNGSNPPARGLTAGLDDGDDSDFLEKSTERR
jgi:hypothetical protein